MPFKKRSIKAGLPPGTPVFIGEQSQKPNITLISYSDSSFERNDGATLNEGISALKKSGNCWVHIDGLSDAELLENLCASLGIHPLVIEDILNTNQRPKFEDYDDYLYVVLRMLTYDNDAIHSEQMSLIVGSKFILSFGEKPSTIFDSVRARLKSGKGRMRKSGPDYLAYALIDSIVDDYFLVLEGYGEKIDSMSEQIITNPIPTTMRQLQKMKKDMILIRKAVWPLRDLVSMLERNETDSDIIKKSTKVYLRDVYDHTIQIIDNVETYRDMMSGMLDIYLSSVSNRLNEIMKVLTIIATIFIPLTFIVGIYGMNFKNMPELQLESGYFDVWLVMLALAVGMIFYFRKRKWI